MQISKLVPPGVTVDQLSRLVREVLTLTLSICKTKEAKNVLRKAALIFNSQDDSQWVSEAYRSVSTQTDLGDGTTTDLRKPTCSDFCCDEEDSALSAKSVSTSKSEDKQSFLSHKVSTAANILASVGKETPTTNLGSRPSSSTSSTESSKFSANQTKVEKVGIRNELYMKTCEEKMKSNTLDICTEDERHKTSTCGIIFSQKRQLLMKRHTREKPYKCSTCGWTFSTRQKFLLHTRIHTGEKPYKCSVCCKEFSRKDKLNDHMKIHTGEKPFICSTCNKAFSRKDRLVDHTKSHSGEKPYKCVMCNKAFFFRWTLVLHLRIHTAEKPYVCSTCRRTFHYRYQHLSHKRSHERTTI